MCALPVTQVTEIVAPQAAGCIPLAPPSVLGNLNVRGRIAIMVDLARRLGLDAAPQAGETAPRSGDAVPADDGPACLIMPYRAELFALRVDAVLDVQTVPHAAGLEPVGPGWPTAAARFAAGTCRTGAGVVLCLKAEQLLDFGSDPEA